MRRLLVLIFVCTIMSSCLLENSEDIFIEVDKTPNPDFSSDLLFSINSDSYYPHKDSIWLTQSDSLYFRIDAPTVFRYEIFIDNEIVLSDNGNSFKLGLSDLVEGVYKLKVDQYVRSGTGSLLDASRKEEATYTSHIILIIGTDTILAPDILDAQLANGSLILTWARYLREDFQGYRVVREGTDDTPERPYAIIEDQNQTSWIDESYVGGLRNFRLYIDQGGKFLKGETGKEFDHTYDPYFTLTPLDDGTTRLSWNKPVFHANVGSLKISMDGKVLSILNWSKNSYVDLDESLIPGKRYEIEIKIQSEGGSDNKYETFEDQQNVSLGTRIPPFSAKIIYNPITKSYYIVNNVKGNRWHEPGYYILNSNFEIVKYIPDVQSSNFVYYYNVIIQSPNFQNIYCIKENSITKRDPNTFEILDTYTFAANQWASSDVIDAARFGTHAAVSNTGIISLPINGEMIALDFNTKELLLTPLRRSISPSDLFEDGNYLIDGRFLYRREGDEYILQYNYGAIDTELYGYVRLVKFLSSDELIFCTYDKTYVYNYRTGNDQIEKYDFGYGANNVYYDEIDNQLVSLYYSADILEIETGNSYRTEYMGAVPPSQIINDHLFSWNEYHSINSAGAVTPLNK